MSFRPSDIHCHFDRATYTVISTERSEWRNLFKNQKELLLDSTRPIGETLNTDLGRPKSTSAGVLSSWYALRATYSRELKVQADLQEKGVRTFIPMMWKRCPVKPGMTTNTTSSPARPGISQSSPTGSGISQSSPTGPGISQSSPARPGIQRKLVPAINNLVFVYWTREKIDSYIRSFADARPVNYYWDRTTNAPLTIPDKDMENFIAVASTLDEDLVFLTEVSDKLREGQNVKVKEGPFKGVEGKIVRIRKSRRILVELPGMLAVASTYVAPEELEII